MLDTLPNLKSSDEDNDSNYEPKSGESSDTNDSEPYYDSDEFCWSSEITNSNSESTQLDAWKTLWSTGAATASKLSRPRKTRADARKDVTRKNRSSVTNVTYGPKSIKAHERLNSVPGEGLSVHNGVLFCTHCTVDLATKMSMVKQHVNSKRHVDRKERSLISATNTRIGTQSLITTAVKAKRAQRYDSGTPFIIAEDVDKYRCQVAYAFLLDGVAFHTLKDPQDDGLRRILESGRHTLPKRYSSCTNTLLLAWI